MSLTDGAYSIASDFSTAFFSLSRQPFRSPMPGSEEANVIEHNTLRIKKQSHTWVLWLSGLWLQVGRNWTRFGGGSPGFVGWSWNTGGAVMKSVVSALQPRTATGPLHFGAFHVRERRRLVSSVFESDGGRTGDKRVQGLRVSGRIHRHTHAQISSRPAGQLPLQSPDWGSNNTSVRARAAGDGA